MVATEDRRGWQHVSPDGEKTLIVELGAGGKFAFNETDFEYATDAITRRDELKQQFSDLKDRVHRWLLEHADVIERAYIGAGSDGLTVVIIRRDQQFDVDFELAVSRFDLDLANLGYLNLPNVNLLSLPCSSPEAVHAFINPMLVWMKS